jgi:hypothetical protein
VSDKSATSRAIDCIIGSLPRRLLKTHGFRKTARTFHLAADPLIKLVKFQHSWLNRPDKAKFTVNVDITVPFFHETWTGQPMPRNPGKAAAVIQRRLGQLTPEHKDQWWTVTPETDTASIAANIEELLIGHGLPFLDEFQTIEQLIDRVETASQPPYTLYDRGAVTAILLKALGRDRESKDRLEGVRAKTKSKVFAKTIDTIQTRLGFTKVT